MVDFTPRFMLYISLQITEKKRLNQRSLGGTRIFFHNGVVPFWGGRLGDQRRSLAKTSAQIGRSFIHDATRSMDPPVLPGVRVHSMPPAPPEA